MAATTPTLQTTETWLQKHERLMIVLIISLVLVFLGNKYLDRDAAKKDAQFQALAAQVVQDKDLFVQAQNQAQTDIKQYQAMVDNLTKQNQTLSLTNQQLNGILSNNQIKDKTAPLPEVATRMAQLSGVQNTDVIALPDGTIDLTTNGAHAIVNQLEEVPVLTEQLTNETKIVANDQTLINQQDKVNTDLNGQITDLKKQNTDLVSANKAEIASVKADARKSKRNWFIRGMITGAGIVTAIVIHLAI